MASRFLSSSRPLAAYLPLMWLSGGFIAGIVFASQRAVTVHTVLLLAVDFFLLAVLLLILRRRTPRVPVAAALSCLALAGFCLGAARYQQALPVLDERHIAWYNDRPQEVILTGHLVEPPDVRDTYTNLRVEAEWLDIGNSENLPVHGQLLVRVDNANDLPYGAVIRLRGHLVTPPESEDFSYREYLSLQGIHALMNDAEATDLHLFAGSNLLARIYALKQASLRRLYRLFPDPEASLLAGILLGNDNGLPYALQQAFKDTGTAHIIAISGFNIAIVAALFVTIFSRLLGKQRGTLVAVLGIALYTILVGATASVVRAAIMGVLGMSAHQVGRRAGGLNILLFTAAIMCAITPFALWDVSFQLSFGATLGLILYAAPLQEWGSRQLARWTTFSLAQRLAKPLAEYLLFTLAAQITTLPITMYHFRRLSLVSFLANPFILPAQPPVMVLSGLALICSFLWFPLGQAFAYLAWPFPAYTIRMVEFFAHFPHGVIVLGDFSFWFLVGFYLLLLAATFSPPRVRWNTILSPALILTTLGATVFLTWSAVARMPDGRLHVTLLDAGTADVVLVQTPDGKVILINGGESPSQLSDALGRRLSPFRRKIDWLVIASTQENQIAALPRVLERYPPDAVLWAGQRSASNAAIQVERKLTAMQRPIHNAIVGSGLDLGSGGRLEVVDVTPRGAVLLLSQGNFRALLPIGANLDTLLRLEYGKKIGGVSALLLADSGNILLNPPEWIATLQPQLVLLSVAAGDPNGLPNPQTIKNVEGYTLLRTDVNGWIEIVSDGTRLWVAAQREKE